MSSGYEHRRLPIHEGDTDVGYALTISIGRNVGDEPMDIDRWLAFRSAVRHAADFAVRSTGNEPYVDEKIGLADYEGRSEESCTVVVTGRDLNVLFAAQLVRSLGKVYGQKQIGFFVSGRAYLLASDPSPSGEQS